MRVLFLSRWYPYPPDNGSKIRIFNLLDALCRVHEVTLLTFFDPERDVSDAPLPSIRPVEISRWPYREFNPRSLRASLGFLSSTPRFLIDTRSPEMARAIKRAVRTKKFDFVVASQLEMASYYDCLGETPALFEEVELTLFRPESADAGLPETDARGKLRWEKHRRYVARLVRKFRACTVASDVERQFLSSAAPGYTPIEILPNCIQLDSYRTGAVRKSPNALIFMGSFGYAPNYDGMVWFLESIYPAIRTQIPEVQLTLTGHPGPHPPLSGPGVQATGYLPDVKTALASSAISVVPLRKGGGTRLKILESMAVRTPVVTTSKGAEGLAVRHGKHLLIADTPREFAECVASLLRNPENARAIAEEGYKLVRSRYDSRVIGSQLLRLIDRTINAEATTTMPVDAALHQERLHTGL